MLQERVKELAGRVKVLTVENETLRAEVEIFRQEAALPNFSKLALGGGRDMSMDEADSTNAAATDLFVRSGQGSYAQTNEVTWKNLHGSSNNLSVALSSDEVVLASGGADKVLRLVFAATADTTSSTRLDLPAPVISIAFAPAGSLRNFLVCGGMDGSATLVQYAVVNEGGRSVLKIVHHQELPNPHRKYVKTVAWSPTQASSFMATAAADGNVHVYRLAPAGFDPTTLAPQYHVQLVESLHMDTAIEAMAFTADDQLLCHARDTPYISVFALDRQMQQTKVNLNRAVTGAAAGGFDEHVSLTVMNLQVAGKGGTAPTHACWLGATDAGRNFVLDPRSSRIVRNLYGHANDGYSQPKAVWGASGQYVLGNTQDDSVVCVWDVASEQLVEKLGGTNAHTVPIRDLAASTLTEALVTTAFDKSTRLWYPSMAS
jgi:WD40 repeat protein